MEATALRRRLTWQVATVLAVTPESARARRLVLDAPDWRGHRAGQHLDVRLTAEDGYTAQRSYSIASAPEAADVALVVEELPDGEVSPYLTHELRVGDQLEVRGPLGGWFVWPVLADAPVQLIAGGSGVVPFLAMLDHHRLSGSAVDVRLLYSARTEADLIGASSLSAAHGPVVRTLTRGAPEGWTGLSRRVDPPMLEEHAHPAAAGPQVFVCGPSPFVESVSQALTELGHDPQRIRTERFGASGGSA